MVVVTKHQKVIDSLKDQVLAEFAGEVHSIILFGSVARGEANADSDVDILIITDASLESERRINDIATDIDLENEVFTQLIFFSNRRLQRAARMRSWFFTDVMNEGVVLYDDGTYERVHQEYGRPVAGVPRG